MTLEYAIDDFSIAQIALAQGDHSLYQSMMQRAHNWQYLFNPATGYVQARNADGSFPAGPAFQTSLLEPGGELGFEEGNAIQYTWSVPQDLAALSSLMGGDAQAVKKLNTFFTVLNAGRDRPFDWAGNEPSLWTPWEYDYFGAPSQTQRRRSGRSPTTSTPTPRSTSPATTTWGPSRRGTCGRRSGMYPVTPGSADLALASPLVPRCLADPARRAAAARPARTGGLGVDALRPLPDRHRGRRPARATPTCASGAAASPTGATTWDQPWLPSSIITTGGTLTFGLSSHARSRVGLRSGAEPSVVRDRSAAGRRVLAPERRHHAPGRARPRRSQLGVRPPAEDGHGWCAGRRARARRTDGVTVQRDRSSVGGSTRGPRARGACPAAPRLRADPDADPPRHAHPGPTSSTSTCRPAGGTALPPVVVDVHVTA